MPISRQRAQRILEEYWRIKAEHPDWSDTAIAAAIPREDGGTGIAPGTLYNAKYYAKEESNFSRVAALKEYVARVADKLPESPPSVTIQEAGATLAISDLHQCDADFLHDSFLSMLDRALAVLDEARPEQLTLVIAGDLVSGTGVFRGQEVRNIINMPHWQALVGAVFVDHIISQLKDIITTIKVIYVKGHHDVAQFTRSELGWWVVDFLRRLANVEAHYYSTEVIINLGTPDCPHYAIVVHGSGYSRFRPQSPTFQENMIRHVMDLNTQRPPEQHIRRVISGHSHWLDVGFRISEWGLAFDSIGGWQRNRRLSLSFTSRPTGGILYLPGEHLRIEEVRPDPDVVARETYDPRLAARNIVQVGELLAEGMERLGE